MKVTELKEKVIIDSKITDILISRDFQICFDKGAEHILIIDKNQDGSPYYAIYEYEGTSFIYHVHYYRGAATQVDVYEILPDADSDKLDFKSILALL